MNKKYEKTHKNLIDCGMRLLFADDFDKVSVQRICKEAHISRPTFYQHFQCKEQLIAEYYASSYFFSEDMKKWVLSAYNHWNAIVRMQMLYIQYTCNADHVDLISRYLSYQLTAKETVNVSSTTSSLEETLTSLIRDAQKEHIITNSSDPYYLCKSIFMLQTGNLFDWCASGGRFDRYADFFWNLEAILCIDDNYRGEWKLEENFMPVF